MYSYFPDSKRLQLSVADRGRARLLSHLLTLAGLDGSRVVSDTVTLAPFVTPGAAATLGMAGVRKAAADGVCCTSIGRPPVAVNGASGLRRTVAAAAAVRSRVWSSELYVWTVDDPGQMSWLINAGMSL